MMGSKIQKKKVVEKPRGMSFEQLRTIVQGIVLH
jgi:hypothetical protein